jgi:hypothetical protein
MTQAQSTIEEQEIELESVEKQLSEIGAGLQADLQEARKLYAENMQSVLNILKERYSKRLEEAAANGLGETNAEAAIKSISLIETPEPVILYAQRHGTRRLNSINMFDHNKTRSFFRRHRITKLQYPELVKLIKGMKDEEFKQKIVCMFNSVVLYANDHERPHDLELMVRLNFAMMRGAIKLGLVPVMASKSYEAFKKM